jgi:hypothetical protein
MCQAFSVRLAGLAIRIGKHCKYLITKPFQLPLLVYESTFVSGAAL